ncbi:diaminopimelate epimerase [Brumimicrobium aurantiacum]|uniref:Diaminopimelate epimerase n=1 Tax=Brumimicrobium aurantiacum TaxID=1737063 RepID=A0A3E1F043_9FLAO|nr:diaminopimelate epimerase [Brumimicrobium aurantiacum]RFC55175.1 diaminopimelate epimerase [Brumimicrobium aurantiacum]
MTLSFTKYQGTGNDFIMVDCTQNSEFQLAKEQISALCDRRFGIGADGVILIFKHEKLDFIMDYYNSDGSKSFCGNGARCAVHFAHSLKLFNDTAQFEAIDGLHLAAVNQDIVSLKMNKVDHFEKDDTAFILDTGSPHYVKFVADVDHENIVEYGQNIRYSNKYKKEGINVNLVEVLEDNHLEMLTYERGVEDETFSCGTGATAVALAYALVLDYYDIDVRIQVKGGELNVKAERMEDAPTTFDSIFLIGPAEKVFVGQIEI